MTQVRFLQHLKQYERDGQNDGADERPHNTECFDAPQQSEEDQQRVHLGALADHIRSDQAIYLPKKISVSQWSHGEHRTEGAANDLCATDPKWLANRAKAPAPRAPTTIRSEAVSSAAFKMTSAGDPYLDDYVGCGAARLTRQRNQFAQSYPGHLRIEIRRLRETFECMHQRLGE